MLFLQVQWEGAEQSCVSETPVLHGDGTHKSVFSHFQGKQMSLPPGSRNAESLEKLPEVILFSFQLHFVCSPKSVSGQENPRLLKGLCA